jgi:hypothetical protein
MKRFLLITIISISLSPVSCKVDRGTILNMPFFSLFGGNSATITSFAINGVQATINGTDITLTLPCDVTLDDLAASFNITGKRVEVNGVKQVNGLTHNDFTNPVVYTVFSGKTSKSYTVSATIANYREKTITLFSINGMNASIIGTSVSLVLPYGTDPSSLVATFNTTGRSVITGGAIQKSGVTANNFSSQRIYTVEACDGSTQNYTVNITIALNSAKDITAFSMLNIPGTIGANTITLTLPYGTDKRYLTPTITHTGAGISPASGVQTDFTNPVEYTVTAANGTTKIYTVTVTVALNDSKDITKFTILGIDGNIESDSITLTVPYGTDKRYLEPNITHTGESVSPPSGASTDFTNPVVYTVTAADGSTKEYTVTITVAANPAKDIIVFTIPGASNVIIGTNTISMTVPFGSGTTHTPAITITGTSVSPASGVPQNFTSTVNYTVTAADNTQKVYAVTVTEAPSNAKDIDKFTILGRDGIIVETLEYNTITVTVPYGSPSTLTPTIVHTGASISPDSGVPTDFTNPVDYTVTAADGSKKVYTVTVNMELNNANNILSFMINGVSGTIGSNTIALTLPYGTVVTNLEPAITVSAGASVSPASGEGQNFGSSVVYTVTAENSSQKQYTVTVTVDPGDDKDITAFSISGVNGTIGSNTINLNLPYGTDKRYLAPTITHTGADISPGSGDVTDFTNPVVYTVTALNGSTKPYTVTVTANFLVPGTYAAGYYHNGSNSIACLWNISHATPSKIDLEASASSKAVSVSVSGGTVYVVGTYNGNACYWKIDGEHVTPHELTNTGDNMVFDSIISSGYLYISGTSDVSGSSQACYWLVDLGDDSYEMINLSVGTGSNGYEMIESGGTIYIAGTTLDPDFGYKTPCYWSFVSGPGTRNLVYEDKGYGRTVMLDGSSNIVIGGWKVYSTTYTQAETWTYSGDPVSAIELPPVLVSPNSSIVSSSLNVSGHLYIVGQRTGTACYWLDSAVTNLPGDNYSYAYGITQVVTDIYITGYHDAGNESGTSSVACVWKKNGNTFTLIPLNTSSATGEAAARDVFIKN